MIVKKGTLVKIKQTILEKENRAKKLPEDTKHVDYLMFVKGFLQDDAKIGEIVTVKTFIGRMLQGELIEVNPSFDHSFGKYIDEFSHINENKTEDEKLIDLHVHTNCSDGDLSIKEMFDFAKESNVSVLSITDHDTIKAYETAYDMAQEYGIELVNGVELSCDYNGEEIHILGYSFDLDNENLNNKLNELREKRLNRYKQIIKQLNDAELQINEEEAIEFALPSDAFGRPHIANFLVTKGYSDSRKGVFEQYLCQGKPGYVGKENYMTPEEACRLIRDANGVVVLAHPGHIKNRELIEYLLDNNYIDGIEVYHPCHKKHEFQRWIDLAKENRLIITGGTDFHYHGDTYYQLGLMHEDVKITFDVYKELREKNNNM